MAATFYLYSPYGPNSPYGLAVCVLVTQAEGRRFESHTKTEISQTFSAYGTESLEAEIR